MMSRFSPPPYPPKSNSRPTVRPSTIRRSRLLYIALGLLFLYIWISGRSPFPRLPHHSASDDLSLRYKHVDWSRYAYFQYATSTAYLCNSIMVFEALERLGSKADRILLYPEHWDTQIESPTDRDSQLLVKARDWYKVKLVPVDIPVTHDQGQEEGEWNTTFTKFMAWGESHHVRIMHLDSDVLVLKNLDELFLLPDTPIAMLRAHWDLPGKRYLSSRLFLLQPSAEALEQLMTVTRPDLHQAEDSVDDILNRFYEDSAMVLPHQQYGLVSREFRNSDHRHYLGNNYDLWDPEQALRDASLVHFVDDPFPKPWVMWPHALYAKEHPQCKGEDCRNKDTWVSLYDDFRQRRKDICALLSAPAPEWPPRNQTDKKNAG